jgi:hypothetical protein
MYGMNPLVAVETAMSGHILEPAGIACLLFAVWFFNFKRQNRILSAAISSIVLGIGAGIKYLPALFSFCFVQKNKLILLFFTLAVFIVFIPMFTSGINSVETLDIFARRWEGNGGIFKLLKASFTEAFTLCGVKSPNQIIHLKFLDPVAAYLQNSFFALHKDSAYNNLKPGAFVLNDLAIAFAKICGAVAFCIVFIRETLKKSEIITMIIWLTATIILFTPVLHPWYILWILPFCAIRQIWPWFVFASALPLAYLSLDSWWTQKIWHEELWVTITEYAALAVAFIIWSAFKGKFYLKQ